MIKWGANKNNDDLQFNKATDVLFYITWNEKRQKEFPKEFYENRENILRKLEND